MIALATSRACIAHLAAAHDTSVVEPDDAARVLDVATGLIGLIPGAAPVLAQLRGPLNDAQERVSITAPLPWGTVILLSRSAVVDGPTLFATGLHELVHRRQIERVGALQSAVDYIGSGELRALREAEACGVGRWARYLVTGVLPSPDDASVLRSDLYHLDSPDKAFARAVVESLLASAEVGALPPHTVAHEALAWLRANAPESIAVEAYR